LLQYACRKTIAERRVRVRGRFASNSRTEQLISEDLTHQQMASREIDTNCNINACNDYENVDLQSLFSPKWDKTQHFHNDRSDQLFSSGDAVQVLDNLHACTSAVLVFFIKISG
jgi:hypothetical protein